MTVTLGFDIYGTLIDTHGVIQQLETMIGDQAPAFSNTWRDKQLEYTFRRGLMRQYENFPVCTRDALNYTCSLHEVNFSNQQKQSLLEGYLKLPTFTDVEQGLTELQALGVRMYAFSNGVPDALETYLPMLVFAIIFWALSVLMIYRHLNPVLMCINISSRLPKQRLTMRGWSPVMDSM